MKQNRAEDIQRGFSKIASRYDLVNHILSFGMDSGWRKKAASFLSLKSNSRVLDLCCGTGDLSLAFAARKEVAQVIGLDFSVEMLELARKKARRSAFASKLSFKQADALKLPYSDNSFDVVSIAFGLRNIAEPQKALTQILRVLRPGGSCVILEFSPQQSGFLKYPIRFYITCIVPFLGGLISGSPDQYRRLSTSIRGFLKKEELLGLLRKQGFRDAQAIALSAGIVNLFVAKKARRESLLSGAV